MKPGTLYVGRLLGIPVRIHVTWLAAFVAVTLGLSDSYFPQGYPGWPPAQYWLLGATTSLLLYASILVHEAAHCLVAKARGLGVHDIVLFVFGGVSEIHQEPPSPGTELAMALAGPLTSLGLGAATGVLWWMGLDPGQPLSGALGYVAGVNLAVAVFNLIPGFPLDGGRVLRAILWWRSRSLEWATRWASRLGRAVACTIAALGLWQIMRGLVLDGLWFALIGWFLERTAQGSYRQLLAETLPPQPANAAAASYLPVRLPGALQDIVERHVPPATGRAAPAPHSTVTLLARFQGWSTSQPR